jgi:hypothetical protein
METKEILHVLRNPYGHLEDYIREARLAACNLIEKATVKVDFQEHEFKKIPPNTFSSCDICNEPAVWYSLNQEPAIVYENGTCLYKNSIIKLCQEHKP